jgi:hypothetical protein
MNERPIPEAAMRDEDALEMLRVWIAEKKRHCSIFEQSRAAAPRKIGC